MDNNVKELLQKFYKIKEKGYIKSIRNGTTGVGATFEKILNIDENRLDTPDYNGIEIKTKRSYSKAYTTLFNLTPEGPKEYETKRLKEKYGYPDLVFKKYKVLNTSISAIENTKVGIKYFFKLEIDKKNEKLFLVIRNKYGRIVEKKTYWTFDMLKEKLYKKMKILAFIDALRKFINGDEYFKYYKMTIYTLKDFETFINLIEEGIIIVTFKIGIFRTGKRQGEMHDHGTSFDMKENDLLKLYNLYKWK